MMEQLFSFDTIKILVTSYCNLKCKHCYQHYDKNKYQLTPQKLIEIVDYAHQHQTKTIDLGGGEFFCHAFSYSLLDYCLSKQINVNIATNATTLSLEYFENCDKKDLITIQVSVDGLQQSHDYRRGMGSFEKMMQTVKKLHEMGIQLTACMALDETNYMDAYEVIQLPYFERFIIMPVASEGAANLSHVDHSSEQYVDYEEIMCYILKNTDCGDGNSQSEVFPRVLAIKYDGNVYPSPVASDYGLLCFGNINLEPIFKIVDRFASGSQAHALSTVDSSNIPECNCCAYSSTCNRGCRFRALKFFGSMQKPDPFYCRIFKNQFSDIPLGSLYWGNNKND